jgi:hypothetical protein
VANEIFFLADKAEDENTKTRSTEWNMSWKKTCGKTTAKTGRHQEELLVAAVYKRMGETSMNSKFC